MDQSNLTKVNYYYRLCRVREACLKQIQDAATVAFVELSELNTDLSFTVPILLSAAKPLIF